MKSSLPRAVGRGLGGTLVRWSIRLFAPKWTVGALVILRDARGRVLLLEHRGRARPWGLPGGLMRWPETPAAAAVRECVEELGLVLREDDLVLLDVLTSDRLPLLEVVYAHRGEAEEGAVRANALQRSEVASFRWCDAEELRRLGAAGGILDRHARLLERLR